MQPATRPRNGVQQIMGSDEDGPSFARETDAPCIAMDEAGNTGENLLDEAQPVYALAAVKVSAADADRLVLAALARTQMSELKFGRLQRSGGGRRTILALLDAAGFAVDTVIAVPADKAWMAASKLVDELVEPRMLQLGVQMDWYTSGEALRMARILYDRGRPHLGAGYSDLVRAFVPLVRDYTDSGARTFLTALRRARLAARDAEVSAVLKYMIDTEEELRAEFSTRLDALDPALACLYQQLGLWSERLGEFEVVHDDAVVVARWAEYLTMPRHLRSAGGPRVIEAGAIRIVLPFGLERITLTQSHRDPRLQIADILAGTCAYVYSRVLGLEPEDAFSRALERRGIGKLILRDIGPTLPPLRAARLGRG